MDRRTVFVGILALTASIAWGQEASRWTIVEKTEGKDTKLISYRRTAAQENREVLVCQKEQRTLTTVVDASGTTVRWTKKTSAGTSMELTREGQEWVCRSADGTSRFSGGELPWVQDLHQLAAFVAGDSREYRFTALADFLDARLKASDMTGFRATKIRKEPQDWVGGSGPCWKVRVTFDDFRSVFWGADYWFRLSDGQLVRYEEVRGGPGTPVTVGVLTSEEE